MTFGERNNMILEMISKYHKLHIKYTSGTKILTNAQWEEYIHAMDKIAEEYALNNISELSWKINQAFQDDTEMVQKKLKGN